MAEGGEPFSGLRGRLYETYALYGYPLLSTVFGESTEKTYSVTIEAIAFYFLLYIISSASAYGILSAMGLLNQGYFRLVQFIIALFLGFVISKALGYKGIGTGIRLLLITLLTEGILNLIDVKANLGSLLDPDKCA